MKLCISYLYNVYKKVLPWYLLTLLYVDQLINHNNPPSFANQLVISCDNMTEYDIWNNSIFVSNFTETKLW